MQKLVASAPARRRVYVVAAIVAGALVLVWIASRIPHTVSIFVLAAFIAFGVYPIVARLERVMPRLVAILLLYAGLIAAIVIVVLLVVPALIAQVQSLADHSTDIVDVVDRGVSQAQGVLHSRFGSSYLPHGYGDLQAYIGAQVGTAIGAVIAQIPNLLVATVSATFVAISAVVLSAFFLLRAESLARQFYALFPERRRDTALSLGGEVARIVGGFVAGQTVLCLVTGVAIWIGLAIVHFKFALLLGIVGGIAYAVPFVGMLAVQLLAAILAAPQGTQTVVAVTIVIFLIARVADNLLAPKILSESLGVSPIMVMFAVFAGGEVFGIPGLLLGIPVAALVKAIWGCFRSPAVTPVVPPVPSAPEPKRREVEAH